ncbi:AAA family ATPase [Paraneptunicella aestuarii]|uniref:KAP family P-loop NTPase fold protein n=1 Tax=Paraneptunicella aestuarii TaxID=2831148 RepID=UPI001E387679|nr:P-loop NTPase fold protein [Paraneptunicella aestuarii]UAA38936.1 AAA family ATPase [Paraneptunicella aestuarii]
MSHKTLNDIPYMETDDFYRHFVSQIAEEIKQSEPPKTIAITGYWGSGKTSALAQVYQKLTNRPPPFKGEISDNQTKEHFVGIWFEAWRYQNEAQPIVALLHSIKQEFTRLQKLKGSMKKLVDVAFLGSLSIFDSVIKAATGAQTDFKNLPKLGEKYEKDNLLSMLPTDMIHLALQEAISALVKDKKEGKRKLIIFIDDLDRCQPEAALKLLEGLKLYLSIPNCVIVMAIDQSQLEQVVKKELGDNASHHFVGVEYLEKLCQDAHRLPLMSQEQGANLIEKELNQIFKQHENVVEIGVTASEIKDVVMESACLPANPRRVKMTINRMASYLRNWKYQDEAPNALAVKGITLLSCLYVSYRQIYEQLEWDINFYDKLDDFTNESFEFADEAIENSPLDGIRQPKPSVEYIGVHPSSLNIFRPQKIIQDIGLAGQQSDFKDVLKQLIRLYNGHQ